MNKLSFEDWLLDNYGMTREEYSKEDKHARRQIKQEYDDYLNES